ncbi:DUF397 domain-containing protein [Glycomyces sp. NPDC047010]|uniref:DUF397 domain-containing protein n=1 Tax=Glycomyces sp. NPDC047010 TaxID=3155023 RepID=UPI0033DB589E
MIKPAASCGLARKGLEGFSMVEHTGWRKSTRSNNSAQADCVEARNTAAGFQVRDSKLGHDSPVFDLGAADFTSLLRATGRS